MKLALAVAIAVHAENSVRPGKFTVQPPTLICLGFEWDIADNDLGLANVNDDFAGRAPDLGAIESGKPTRAYGPPGQVAGQPFYR